MDIFKSERKFHMNLNEVYFWTSTVYQWKHLFKPDQYKDILIESLTELTRREVINIYGFVIMPNHIHLLWEMLKMNGKETPQASFLKYTAHKIQNDLREYHPAVLERFWVNEKDRQYRFWQRDPKAVKIFNKTMLEQKLNYIHLNPLQEHWNLATCPEEYHYSSAEFYETSNSKKFSFLTHYLDRF